MNGKNPLTTHGLILLLPYTMMAFLCQTYLNPSYKFVSKYSFVTYLIPNPTINFYTSKSLAVLIAFSHDPLPRRYNRV